jgi:hypothetical protein
MTQKFKRRSINSRGFIDRNNPTAETHSLLLYTVVILLVITLACILLEYF